MSLVMIGCPVRNRAWILPEYLDALTKLHYNNHRRFFFFLENDSDDGTREILREFAYGPIQPWCQVARSTSAVPHWKRGDYAHDQYKHLADLRNTFLDCCFRQGADYVLSIDSDIIASPQLLEELLKHADENTIVGAAISNIADKPLDGLTPGNFMVKYGGLLSHPIHYPLSGIIDVDVTGAVYLIPRKVYEPGVKYGQHSQGEDIYFCEQAKKKGFNIKVVLDPLCEHRMTEKEVITNGSTHN